LTFFVGLPKLFQFPVKVIWHFVSTLLVLLASPKPSHILLQVCEVVCFSVKKLLWSIYFCSWYFHWCIC